VLRFKFFGNQPQPAYNTGLAKWLSDTQANAQKPLRQAPNWYYREGLLLWIPKLAIFFGILNPNAK